MPHKITRLCIGLSLFSLTACATGGLNAAGSGQLSEQGMIIACTATANNYPYSRDRLLFDEYGALFTEDAEFQIEGGPRSVGREAIVTALKTRGPLMQTRHMNRVVDMRVSSGDEVRGLSYVTVWRKGDHDDEPSRAGEVWVVGEYHDQFLIQGKKCLIKKRLVKIVFQQP